MNATRDPFDQLAASGTESSVDATFAALLRARVQRALGTTGEGATQP